MANGYTFDTMRPKLHSKPVPTHQGLKLNKPNDALVMVPKVGRLNPRLRKMFNVMLQFTQTQIAELREQGLPVLGTTLFSANLRNLVERTSDNESDARSDAKRYLLEMRRTEVDWEAPDAGSNVIWANMGLLSQVQLETRNGEVWVAWALPPALLSAVADPERYTPIDTGILARLHSYAAIALYDICARYRHNPTNLTSNNPTGWWIDALRAIPPELDPVTKTVKRPAWRKFKNEQLNSAVDEINNNTDITVEIIEFKTHRAIDSVQFLVRLKENNNQKNANLVVNVSLTELASRTGLSY